VDVGKLSRHGATKEVATLVVREMTVRSSALESNSLAVSARVLGTDAQGRITGKLKDVEGYELGFDGYDLKVLSPRAGGAAAVMGDAPVHATAPVRGASGVSGGVLPLDVDGVGLQRGESRAA
jgi:hypothetical protein